VRSEGELGDDAKAAASSALDRPEEVGICTGIGDAHRAVGRDDLGFQEPRRDRAVVFRKASETAALDEPRDTDGNAAAALDVAADLRRHRIIDIDPHGARFDRDSRLRGLCRRAPRPDKAVMQDNAAHRPRPDQQRIHRIGRTQIAVPAALDDQPQIVVAGEIDCSDNVSRGLGRHGVDARLRFPRIEPARALRQRDIVADVIGVFQLLEEVAAGAAVRCFATGTQRRIHFDESSADRLVQLCPARLTRPIRVGRPYTAKRRIFGNGRPQGSGQDRQDGKRRRARKQASSVDQ